MNLNTLAPYCVRLKVGERDKRKSFAGKESGKIIWAYDERYDSECGSGRKGTLR